MPGVLQPGKPSRKSEKFVKANDPKELPGECMSRRSRSNSNPARTVCFPWDQEIESAASHALSVLIFARLLPEPNCILGVEKVICTRAFIVGTIGVIPTC